MNASNHSPGEDTPSGRLAAVGAAFELLRHEINNPIQALLAATMAGDAVAIDDFRHEVERLAALQRLLTHVAQSLEAPHATVPLGAVLERLKREHLIEVASSVGPDPVTLPAPSAAVVELMVASRGRRNPASVALREPERMLEWSIGGVAVSSMRRPLWRSLARRVGLSLRFEASRLLLRQAPADRPRRGPAPAGRVAEPLRSDLLEVLADGDVAGVRDLLRSARSQGAADPALLDHMDALLQSFALAELTALLSEPA